MTGIEDALAEYPWDEDMGCYARKFGSRGLILVLPPGPDEQEVEGWSWIAAFRGHLAEAQGFQTLWETLAHVERQMARRIAIAQR